MGRTRDQSPTRHREKEPMWKGRKKESMRGCPSLVRHAKSGARARESERRRAGGGGHSLTAPAQAQAQSGGAGQGRAGRGRPPEAEGRGHQPLGVTKRESERYTQPTDQRSRRRRVSLSTAFDFERGVSSSRGGQVGSVFVAFTRDTENSSKTPASLSLSLF